MRARPLIAVSIGIVLLMMIVAMAALSSLPADARLPVHWNAAGEADGFASAAFALFMPAALTAVFSVLFAVLPSIEPLQERMSGSAALLNTCWAGLLALFALTQLTIAAPAFGLTLPATLHLAGLGILLVVIGNALPKSRPGFFIGIRTPWTLTDTDNWIATHRLAARTMMIGGAVIIAAAWLPVAAGDRTMLVGFALFASIVPPVVYSYWFWHRNGTQA